MATPGSRESDEGEPSDKKMEGKKRPSNGRSSRERSPSKKGNNSKPIQIQNSEVDLLRKEIEEMKFYQELEQTEYQEMKEKMHTYEKQMKEMEKKKTTNEKASSRPNTASSRANTLHKIEEESEMLDLHTNIDTVDLIGSSPKESSSRKLKKASEKDLILQKKLMKRDSQIEQLKTKLHEKVLSSKESSDKMKTLAKEYERRLVKMEKLKDEEIEDIKDHYKQIMETLAKQVQKTGKRHNDVIKKNSDLRAMMEEMRSDMAKREKELERKIKLQQAAMKKNEVKLTKAESKLDRTGSKYSSMKNELDETLKSNRKVSDKLQELEDKYENEISNLQEKYEKDTKEIKEAAEIELTKAKEEHEKETTAMQLSVEEEIATLTGKLVDMERLFDEEAAEHDKTMTKLADTEAFLKEKEEEIANLVGDSKGSSFKDSITELKNKIEEMKETHTKEILENAAERLALKKELESSMAKLRKTETELKILNDDKGKKNKNLKKKIDEIEEMQKKTETMKQNHARELRMKDVEYAKARKKWTMSEQKLQNEVDELIKERERFESLGETDSGHLVLERAEEDKKTMESQKKLIEQLKADKASLQMTVATLEGKAETELLALEKELTKTKRLLASTNYDRRLEKKMQSQHHIGDSDNAHADSSPVDDSRKEEETLDLKPDIRSIEVPGYDDHQHASIIKEERQTEKEDSKVRGTRGTSLELESGSSDESTYLVASEKLAAKPAEPKSGLTTQRSYRNYVRNRKFSKRNIVSDNE